MSEIDIDLTDKLVELFKIPQGDRDAGWMMEMLNTVPTAALTLAEPEVQKGPDGFSYLQLAIPPEEREFKGYSISHLLDTCIEKGVGAVILPDFNAAAPYWVFTYGNLLSYKLLGAFDARNPSASPPPAVPAGERKVLISQPSETYLPAATRALIKQFLSMNGVKQPAMFMLTDPALQPAQQLVFNVFRADYPSDDHYNAVCQRITWYLPPSYSFVTLPNDKTQFQPSFVAM